MTPASSPSDSSSTWTGPLVTPTEKMSSTAELGRVSESAGTAAEPGGRGVGGGIPRAGHPATEPSRLPGEGLSARPLPGAAGHTQLGLARLPGTGVG